MPVKALRWALSRYDERSHILGDVESGARCGHDINVKTEAVLSIVPVYAVYDRHWKSARLRFGSGWLCEDWGLEWSYVRPTRCCRQAYRVGFAFFEIERDVSTTTD